MAISTAMNKHTWNGEGTLSTHVRIARIAVHTGTTGCKREVI